MNFIIRMLVNALAVMVSAYLLRGVKVDSFVSALIVAIVLAVLNLLVKPILVILTLPVTIVTLGLFLFVINAIIILIASKLVSGFHVQDFFWALIFSLILSIVSSIMNSIAGTDND
jgi:putative membrane protein